MIETKINTEKSISEAFSDRWRQLTRNQQRFCVAMLDSSSKRDAALSVGIKPDTVYRWSEKVDPVIEIMRTQIRESAMAIVADRAVKAAAIKGAGLDSDDERVRQDVASEILDRVLGKPMQRREVRASVQSINLSQLTDDQLERIANGENPASVLGNKGEG